MGIVKKKKKLKRIDLPKNQTVGDAIKKGLVPYVDFYPTPKGKDYIYIDPNKKPNLRRDAAYQRAYENDWASVVKVAKLLFKTPKEANDLMLRESTVFKSRDTNTYILCARIEKDLKETKLKLNKLIDTKLQEYCLLIGEDYSKINPSRRDLQKKNVSGSEVRKKKDRQKVIDAIVMRHNRLVKHNTKKFKDWLKENSHLV